MDLPPLQVATAAGLHELPGGKVRFEGREINALARKGESWSAIVEGREIWTRGAGRGWEQKTTVPTLRALCLQPTSHGLLIGTAEARLLRLHRGELKRVSAFDAMAGRNNWFTPWGGPPDTRSISRGADDALYVNVHVGGVARSLDRGEHWEATIDIESDVHQVLAHPSQSRTVLAASAVGLGVSTDRGDTWKFEKNGFHALYQRAVAVVGSVVLVSASRNERGERAAVYRRALRGDGPFEKCRAGLPEWFADNVNTGCIAAEGSAAAIGTTDGSVFGSSDSGRSWKLLRDGLPKIRALVFSADKPQSH